jgi:hypothetical protein
MKRVYIFACIACVSLAACRKEGDDQPKPVTMTISGGTGAGLVYQPDHAYPNGMLDMTVKFIATAYNGTRYVPARLQVIGGTISTPQKTPGPFIQVAIDNSISLITTNVVTASTYCQDGDNEITPDANGNYEIPAGSSYSIYARVAFVPPAAGSYRLSLVNVNSNTDDSGTVYSMYTVGLNTGEYSTQYFQVP